MSEPLTLQRSLELAGNNLLSILAPACGYLPYWSVNFGRDRRAHVPHGAPGAQRRSGGGTRCCAWRPPPGS